MYWLRCAEVKEKIQRRIGRNPTISSIFAGELLGKEAALRMF
jgi:hypothetical protein